MAEPSVGTVLPSSLDEILASVAEFDDKQFVELVQATSGPEGLSADKERCEKLASEIGVPPAAVGYLLSALNFVYSALPAATEHGSPDSVGLNNILNGIDFNIDSDRLDKIRSRIRTLLIDNTNISRYKKLVRLRDGFIRSAISFSSFVDLRPNFDEEKTVISSVIPIVQFRVRTNSSVDAEENIVFQMDRKAVRRLKEAVDYVSRKLDAIDASDFLINKIDEFDRE